MNKLILGSVAALALSTTAAVAADPIMPTPVTPVAPAPVTFDWNGFYAGLNAGFGMGVAYDEDGDALVDGGDTFDSVNGFLGGVQAGANFQMDMFVLGVEGDIQLTTMSQEGDFAGEDITINLDYFGTLRARAGVALDNVLPYVTGGLAFGGLTIDDDGGDVDSNNHFGWTVGGGVEVAMDTNTSFKIEYLYTDLGTAEYDTGAAIDEEVGFRFHTIRAGVNFHF